MNAKKRSLIAEVAEARRYALDRCDAAARELQALVDVLSRTGPASLRSHTALASVMRLRRELEEL